MSRYLTTRQVGELCDAPEWETRLVVDSLGVPIERFGLKRMIPAELLPRIMEELRKRRESSSEEAD